MAKDHVILTKSKRVFYTAHVAIVVPGACSESPCKAPWQIWSAGKLESAQKLQTTSQCLDVRCILELFSEDSSL